MRPHKNALAYQFSKHKWIVIAVVAILGIAGYKFMGGSPMGGGMPMGGTDMAMPVSVAVVEEREVVQWDEFSGRLEAVDRVEIRPRVAGTIEKIFFDEGQAVKKGDLLFTIDPRPYQAEVNRAQAELDAAQSKALFAKAEFVRAAGLIKNQTIPQRDYDSKKEAAASADANVKVAETILEQAKLSLDYSNITAPVSGRVSRAEITKGNLVNAGGEAPILTTIVSQDPIYASFDADEQTFVRYMQANGNNPDKLKQVPVFMGLSGEKELTHAGQIKSFDNELNTRAGTVRVRAMFDNPNGTLIPGLFARIRIGGGGKEKVALVNEQAIGTDQNKKFVYVVGSDNTVAYREVSLGGLAEGLRVVKTGLSGGEQIVVNGLQRVRPGVKVAPQVVPMEHPALAAPMQMQLEPHE